MDHWLRQIEQDGFALATGVYGAAQVEAMLRGWDDALAAAGADEAAIRGREGSVYAARNVLELWPAAATVWRQPPLPDLLERVLGPGFGLVRALFFDKPPDRSWSLPWHKDMTVAVRDNRWPSDRFGKPTRKAGVPHVEAPRELLDAMLTARVHLDDVTDENGPLRVLPGSHVTGKRLDLSGEPRPVHARRGDVLLIRPLVTHGSAGARPGTRRHRRILHLEFAASGDLPDGYAWHSYLPGRPHSSPS